ncbi:MAG: SRPBCC family protein [Haloarculaceae archaeon]
MPEATATVHIDAPLEECFEYLRDPDNHVGVVPGLREIDAEPLDGEGHEGTFTYTVAGVELDLGFRDVELDPPHKRVFEVSGPMEGTATYEFEADGEGTRFTLTNSYDLPGPDVLGSLAEPLVKRYLQSDVESWTENAKVAIENQ